MSVIEAPSSTPPAGAAPVETPPAPVGPPPAQPGYTAYPTVPRPPRRVPKPPVLLAPLSPAQAVSRSVIITAVLLLFAFLLQVVVLSQLQHLESQQRLRDAFRAQLAAGTAPVSEADYTGKMLRSTSPVGILSIPQIGVNEVLVEGTDSDTLKTGAGHRRDTPLPGQPGVSVLIGRAAAYGGPFSHIQELAPGDRFTVRTGQGSSTFEVIGVRYAGDPTPAALARGGSRLVLQSARGPAFAPNGVVYVDARLVSPVMDAGARWTTTGALPPEDRALQADTREVWGLVFALQFLLAAHLGAVWARRRVGSRKTWLVGAPVVALAVLLAADRIVPLLPNVL